MTDRLEMGDHRATSGREGAGSRDRASGHGGARGHEGASGREGAGGRRKRGAHECPAGRPDRLPGTELLRGDGDPAAEMVAGIRAYLERLAERRRRERVEALRPPGAGEIDERRRRLAAILGVVDPRESADSFELVGAVRPATRPAGVMRVPGRSPDPPGFSQLAPPDVTPDPPAGQQDKSSPVSTVSVRAAARAGYDVYAVRWPALDGVEGEGLLLKPMGSPSARVIAIPHAGWTPEMAAGLEPGGSSFAVPFALVGCEVLIPTLINLDSTWSGDSDIETTNQPHREFVYRMAYEVGRHVIGYEIQKILAAVDLWTKAAGDAFPVGVFGYGEGGMLALYAGALDPRIAAVGVSGFFGDRFQVWRQPVYRNVWRLLTEFTDAEVAALIAPRPLVVEATEGPVETPPVPLKTRSRGDTAAPGELSAVSLEEARAEARLVRRVYEALGAADRFRFVEPPDRRSADPPSCCSEFMRALTMDLAFLQVERDPGPERGFGGGPEPRPDIDSGRIAGHRSAPPSAPEEFRLTDPQKRQRRQVRQLVEFTQKLVRRSHLARKAFFWDRLDLSSHENYRASLAYFRKHFWEEVTGRLPQLPEPGPVQSRLVEEEADHRIFEVKLPLDETLFAYGALLLPSDLRPGERRPVVVCQHGLEGRPEDTYRTDPVDHYYQGYARRLVKRGYVVYAPQNPYTGGDAFRTLQRMANPFGLTLFSFILEQHARALAWLKEQPYVDPERIGFYGLSYGGVTAMRVPSLLEGYALSICSANFNEWTLKKASSEWPFSYLYTREYEMPEFNLGNTYNYAEMAALIAPRPFMVERGRKDGVGLDEWVAFEYAKVERLYAGLGIPERTRIARHGGGHVIDGAETFPFLDAWLGIEGRPVAK